MSDPDFAQNVPETLREVHKEVLRQEELWGVQHHPTFPNHNSRDRYKQMAQRRANELKAENAQRVASGNLSWDGILFEEVFEGLAEDGDPEKMIEELTQVAAVAVSWIEDLKRGAGD